MDQAEHIAQLLAQGPAFAALMDALRGALIDDAPPDLERARQIMAGLLLWGWGQGYYPRNPAPILRAMHRADRAPAGPEEPPTTA